MNYPLFYYFYSFFAFSPFIFYLKNKKYRLFLSEFYCPA